MVQGFENIDLLMCNFSFDSIAVEDLDGSCLLGVQVVAVADFAVFASADEAFDLILIINIRRSGCLLAREIVNHGLPIKYSIFLTFFILAIFSQVSLIIIFELTMAFEIEFVV